MNIKSQTKIANMEMAEINRRHAHFARYEWSKWNDGFVYIISVGSLRASFVSSSWVKCSNMYREALKN